jgi:hypothetical protein
MTKVVIRGSLAHDDCTHGACLDPARRPDHHAYRTCLADSNAADRRRAFNLLARDRTAGLPATCFPQEILLAYSKLTFNMAHHTILPKAF